MNWSGTLLARPTSDDATLDGKTAFRMLTGEGTDVANLTLASTFLGQFLSDRPFSVRRWPSRASRCVDGLGGASVRGCGK